jgi:hypothetical protein
MKILSLFVLTLIIHFAAAAQTINIPDANFKARLLGSNSVALNADGNNFHNTADSNGNGEIEINEALAVTGLRIHTIGTTSNDIYSLEGLQYFTNLKSLWCSDNPLGGTLDVSMLPQLKYLVCNNAQLTGITLPNPNILEEILLSGNSFTTFNTTTLGSLKYLYIAANNISTLDMAPLTAVTYLEAGYNPLTTINLATNSNLHSLYLNNTQITVIDASVAPALRTLHCSNNPNLTTINVRNSLVSGSDPDMLDYAFMFNNLPALNSICIDEFEQFSVGFSGYNSNGNVTVYTGINCDVVVNMGTNSIADNDLKEVRIYPNPVASTLYLEDIEGHSIIRMEIYNTLGQTVKVIPVNTQITHTDVSELSSGTYIVKLISDKGSATNKIVKL